MKKNVKKRTVKKNQLDIKSEYVKYLIPLFTGPILVSLTIYNLSSFWDNNPLLTYAAYAIFLFVCIGICVSRIFSLHRNKPLIQEEKTLVYRETVALYTLLIIALLILIFLGLSHALTKHSHVQLLYWQNNSHKHVYDELAICKKCKEPYTVKLYGLFVSERHSIAVYELDKMETVPKRDDDENKSIPCHIAPIRESKIVWTLPNNAVKITIVGYTINDRNSLWFKTNFDCWLNKNSLKNLNIQEVDNRQVIIQ